MVDVFVNGVKFVNGTDFTATNGTTVVMAAALAAGNIVEIDNLLTAYLPTNALRTITTFTATAAQTTFSVSYTQGLIDVFYNGSNLAQSEYTATNGTSIILATACQLNDIVVVYAYSYSVGAYSGIAGSGTINTIPKFTASSTIGNSQIFDNGTNVLINSTTTDFGILGITTSNAVGFTSALGIGFRTNVAEGDSVGISFKTKISLGATIWENARIAAITESVTTSANGTLAFYTMNQTVLAERLRITSAGIIYNSNPPANDFAARFVGNTTTGQSFGLQVWGGTNSSDTAFRVLNASTSTEYFKIRGDGVATFAQSVTAAAFYIPSANVAGARDLIAGENTNTGTTGKVRAFLQNSTTSLLIEKYGTGYTSSGIATTAGSAIYDDGAGGLSIGATNGSGTLRLFSGGTEYMRITNGGTVLFGTTATPYNTVLFRATNGSNNYFSFGPNSSNVWAIWNDGGTGVYLSNGNSSWTGVSDERVKNIERNIENACDIIKDWRTVIFSWKHDSPDNLNVGLIAQDVIKTLPEAVDINQDEDKTLGVRYTELIPVLVKAIQEMNTKIIELEKIVATK
jgi:hypothetical protein